MSEHYELLSKSLPTGLGPCRWVADETISDRILKKGTTSGWTAIENVDDAAQVFGDLLAEKEHGDLYSALLVSTYLKLPTAVIFEMQPGTPAPGGGHYVLEPMFFAVLVKSEER